MKRYGKLYDSGHWLDAQWWYPEADFLQLGESYDAQGIAYNAIAAELAETKRALAVVQDTSIAHAGKQSDLIERTLKEGYDIQARQRDRIRELEAALRYWMPELNEIDVAAEELERWQHDRALLATAETGDVKP